MSVVRSFSAQDAALRPQKSPVADIVVFVAVAVVLWLVVHISQAVLAPFDRATAPTSVPTDPALLPYFAARSLLRMFAALAASLIFTLIYATAAARSRRAERVLIPLLDVLQSVPVLGFLSITMAIWLTLFPTTGLGVELAAIFAIFTSQVWNMTFAFYQSLITQPRELDEAARLVRLTRWQRFWRLDVPHGVVPLTWNGMMSFGGGWFFLVASEVISVNGETFALPGIGSYVAAASEHQQIGRLLLAILTMVAMIVVVNAVFWRPLTAWAERFRTEDTVGTDQQRSVVLDLLRRSMLPRVLGRALRPVGRFLDRATRVFGVSRRPLTVHAARRRAGDIVLGIAVGVGLAWGLVSMLDYVSRQTGLQEFAVAVGWGFVTFARVVVLLVVASLVWIPGGLWIGLDPRVTRFAQPVVQVLASFPANFLFPFFTLFLLRTGISIDIGGIVLMALGSQWYILFNVIAGASAIPNDVREASGMLRLGRAQRWRKVYLPAVFGSWVTGALTAAGGAWNASIVAEVVSYGGHTLEATGLGSYIATATQSGDFARTLVGVSVMSLFVVGLNRTLWRRLYALAESRYSLT